MTTAYVEVAVFERGDTYRHVKNDTYAFFSEDGAFDLKYLIPYDEFDHRVSFTDTGSDFINFGYDITYSEISILTLEFGTSSADYMAIVDLEAGLEYFIQLSSQGPDVPDFPTTLSGYNSILYGFTDFGLLDSDADGNFSIDIYSLFDAPATEDDEVHLFYSVSNDDLDLGAGNDVAYTGAGSDRVEGGDGNDRLVANSDRTGAFDNAVFFGGNDDDFLKAKNLTRAEFYGEAGADKLMGAAQNDMLDGGLDADQLFGLAGDDDLFGRAGDDAIYGGAGNDYLVGGAGNDLMRGNRDSDTMEGGAGADEMRGGGGGDSLDGGDDADYLLGEGGSDTLSGGAGDDTLVGGYGAGLLDGVRDTFVFAPGGGFDRVKDFENGIDRLDLTAFGFTDFTTEVLTLASDRSTGMRLDFADGSVAFLEGMTVADFDASDVILS